MKHIPILLFCAFAFFACDENNVPFEDHMDEHRVSLNIDSVESIIRLKSDSFAAAHVSGDTNYLNGSFSKDARIFPPSREIVSGKKSIAALNAEWISYDIHEFVQTSIRFYGHSDLVIDEGTYTMSFGVDSLVNKGKYVNVWKHENGDWKLHSNIWNAN